jgi:signal transduction histidine kinase
MNHVYLSLDVLVFLSIPQTFLFVWFAFLCLGIEPVRLRTRTVWLSVLMSIYLDISGFLALPAPIPMLNGMAALLLGLHLAFRELNWKQKGALFVIACGMIVLSNDILLHIALYSLNPELVRSGPAIYKIVFAWPFFAIVAALNWLFYAKRIHPFKSLMTLLQRARHTPVLYFILLLITQILVLGLFLATRIADRYSNTFFLSFFAGIIAILIISYLALRLIAKTRDESIRITQTAYANDLMQLFSTIRGQRHDFINRVQEMYTLLKAEEKDELRIYMENSAEEIKSVNGLPGHSPTTAIEAFCQAKLAIAIDKKIRFVSRMDELPDSFSSIKQVDLIRILGNLVDNAFDEVVKLPAIERYVELGMRTEREQIVIEVTNRGCLLRDEDRLAMFTPGFSTKEGDHSGLGLPIVIEKVRHYGGEITVRSDEIVGVMFTVRLPMASMQAES